MSNKDWWSDYGPFKSWSECPTRPDPGEVLLFYLAKRGIGPEEQVVYLIDILDLQKSMVYTIFRDKPLLAYLGMKLRTWDHGLEV